MPCVGERATCHSVQMLHRRAESVSEREEEVVSHERLLDLRHEQTETNRRDACEYRRGAVVQRDPRAITGVCLHQTAKFYGVADYQALASKGDVVLARHRRFLMVNAHITASRHGRFVLAHDLVTYVQHGDLLNAADVGIEHEGHYSMDGEAIDKPASVDVGEIIEAGRAALTYVVESLPNVKFVHAHRQSRRAPKAAKTSCCGARIFLEVAVQHGVRKLGLSIEPDRVWGSGWTLPKNWYGAR